MKNRAKALKISFTVFVVCVIVLSALFVSQRNRRFDFAEKNTIAMGTVLTQKVYSERAGQHITHITSIVNSLENVISKRIEASPVALINKGEKVKNSSLAGILEECIELSEKSGGAFDVTVGKVARLWNIGEEGERIPAESEIRKALSAVGSEGIIIKDNEIALGTSCEIDLGAVGKGLACDYVMNYLRAADDIDGAVVSVGGSNVVYGKYNKAGDMWRVAVRHPREENSFLGVITLSEGFISTSGDYEKYFEKDGKRYHHILDAETGYPADSGLISVTVVCDNGFLSDALSTACFILGEEKGKALLEKYNASGIFVSENMEISVVGEIDFEAF
ncbi:MAG: FAD:protein FMN transferase [Acutalibacteraceae bacterium]|nr:FAD:protein FMN transferase [Acutalibacteraceae bacterium]